MRRLFWIAVALALMAAQAGAQTSGGSAPSDGGCDPQVEAALLNAASEGVERDLTVIRHPEEGIGEPDSIFDMDCDFFRFPDYDAHVSLPSLGDLIDALKRRACALARTAWRRNVGRAFDRSIYGIGSDIDRLPGLGPSAGAVVSPGGSRPAADVFRKAISGESGQ